MLDFTSILMYISTTLRETFNSEVFMNYDLIGDLCERSLALVRDGNISFTVKDRTFNAVISDECEAGVFVDLYSDGNPVIRTIPYWEDMVLPINIFTDEGIEYHVSYPLGDFSKSDDETFKEYLIVNFKNAIVNIPTHLF